VPSQGEPRDAAVNFHTYRIFQRHSAVSLSQHGFPVSIIIGSDRRPETKQEIEGKMLGSDRDELGIVLGLAIRIADMNQIADLKLSLLAPVKFRSPI